MTRTRWIVVAVLVAVFLIFVVPTLLTGNGTGGPPRTPVPPPAK